MLACLATIQVSSTCLAQSKASDLPTSSTEISADAAGSDQVQPQLAHGTQIAYVVTSENKRNDKWVLAVPEIPQSPATEKMKDVYDYLFFLAGKIYSQKVLAVQKSASFIAGNLLSLPFITPVKQ
jgi:hypothetical protein